MLSLSDLQTLSDWLNVTTGPYEVVGWMPGPSNDGKERLHPIRKLIDAAEPKVMALAGKFSFVSARSGNGQEIRLPSGMDPTAVHPLSLTDTLADLQSWPEFLESALPDTVLASLDMCEGGQRLAEVIEDVAHFLRDLCEQIADRGFDRTRPETQ